MTTKFNILGRQLSFDEGHALYINIRNTYYEQALKCTDRFINNFDTKYYNLNGFISNANDDVNEMLCNAIDAGVNFLYSIGVYEIDFDSFTEYCDKYIGEWNQSFNEVVEEYEELIEYKQEAREYREARKDSRGRFVGGGFGISGALKGAAKAGALNTTTGLFHSFANALGNVATSAEVSSRMSKIFNNQEVRDSLNISIYEDIFSIHYALVDVINEKTDFDINVCYTDDNYRQSKVIYNNLINNKIPQNKIKEALGKMIIMFPFSYNYYELILDQFEDEYNEIEQYANYFGIDIKPIKEKIESEIQSDMKLIEIFGEDKKQYMDSLLSDNIFYKKLKDKINDNILNNLIMGYNVKPEIFESKVYMCNFSPKFEEKLITSREIYNISSDESPLILFDNTAFGSAKNGFILTNKALYVHNMFSKTWIEPLSNIKDIYFNECKIIINDKKIDIDLIGCNNREIFNEYIKFAIYLTSIIKETVLITQTKSPIKLESQNSTKENIKGKCFPKEEISKLLSCVNSTDIKENLFLSNENGKLANKIANIKSSYASLNTSETILVFFDNTVFGSAKDGFCITDKKIYVHNIMEKPFSIDLASISIIDLYKDRLLINGSKINIELISKKNREEFKNLISNIISCIRD